MAFESDVSRKMSSVGECSFGMVMREDFFFTELFFLDGTGEGDWLKKRGGGSQGGSVGGLS